jgi:hypothetical protein
MDVDPPIRESINRWTPNVCRCFDFLVGDQRYRNQKTSSLKKARLQRELLVSTSQCIRANSRQRASSVLASRPCPTTGRDVPLRPGPKPKPEDIRRHCTGATGATEKANPPFSAGMGFAL